MAALSETPQWLVATDLDGTLLDDDYPLTQAAAALDSLCRDGSVLVALASSKTLAEMIQLARLCTTDPILIFENGAGVAWHERLLQRSGNIRIDDYQVSCSGLCHAELHLLLADIRAARGFSFIGFSDMPPQQIAALTGLDLPGAMRARDRLLTEPLVWQDSDENLSEFRRLLATQQLQLVCGGRFQHVMPMVSKADAVSDVRDWLSRDLTSELKLLSCGDAPNDLEMLQAADHALVFPSRQEGYLMEESDKVSHAPAPGPEPWLRAVSAIIKSASQPDLQS